MDNLPSRSLFNDVFQILDSRVQYIEYQLSKLSRQSLLSSQNNTLTESSLFSIEITFKQIELHNRSLKLLILLRSRLNVLNAPVIFELLTDSKYLDYDEQDLRMELAEEDSKSVLVTQRVEANR
ncbi:MAG: hypothetical protein ACI8YQ_004425 [Polaribacter sp.]|jgi:hypothetical protein